MLTPILTFDFHSWNGMGETRWDEMRDASCLSASIFASPSFSSYKTKLHFKFTSFIETLTSIFYNTFHPIELNPTLSKLIPLYPTYLIQVPISTLPLFHRTSIKLLNHTNITSIEQKASILSSKTINLVYPSKTFWTDNKPSKVRCMYGHRNILSQIDGRIVSWWDYGNF